jgi:hypothetical protein
MYMIRVFMVSAQEYFTWRNWVVGRDWELRAIKEEEKFIGAEFAPMGAEVFSASPGMTWRLSAMGRGEAAGDEEETRVCGIIREALSEAS